MKKLFLVFVILGVLVNVSCMGNSDHVSETASTESTPNENVSEYLPVASGDMGHTETSFGITWETKAAEAYARAEKEGKNVFVLITAPSWCHWCQELEKNVLSVSSVTDYISANYVPLLVLDVVDGQRNPELSNFVFSGFPTVRVYDEAGNIVNDVYTQDPDQFLGTLKDSVDMDAPTIASRYTIKGSVNGELLFNGENSFVMKLSDGTERTFEQAAVADVTHFYIYNEDNGDYIAIPYQGGEAHVANNSSGEWTEWAVFGNISIAD